MRHRSRRPSSVSCAGYGLSVGSESGPRGGPAWLSSTAAGRPGVLPTSHCHLPFGEIAVLEQQARRARQVRPDAPRDRTQRSPSRRVRATTCRTRCRERRASADPSPSRRLEVMKAKEGSAAEIEGLAHQRLGALHQNRAGRRSEPSRHCTYASSWTMTSTADWLRRKRAAQDLVTRHDAVHRALEQREVQAPAHAEAAGDVEARRCRVGLVGKEDPSLAGRRTPRPVPARARDGVGAVAWRGTHGSDAGAARRAVACCRRGCRSVSRAGCCRRSCPGVWLCRQPFGLFVAERGDLVQDAALRPFGELCDRRVA